MDFRYLSLFEIQILNAIHYQEKRVKTFFFKLVVNFWKIWRFSLILFAWNTYCMKNRTKTGRKWKVWVGLILHFCSSETNFSCFYLRLILILCNLLAHLGKVILWIFERKIMVWSCRIFELGICKIKFFY